MKTILITGASSGIGRALAVRAARAGYAVYAVGRNIKALVALAGQIGEEGGIVKTDVTDVSDPANAPGLVGRMTAAFGHIDIVVNNAGAVAVGQLASQSDEDLRAQFGTHVVGPLAIVREALPSLRATRGHVFMIGSGVARVPVGGLGAYPPSKAALRSATAILRRELFPLEIAVTYVDPGAVDTTFMSRAGLPGAPASVLVSPELVARKILLAIGTRPRVLNVAPLQTAAVAVAELLPGLTEALLERNPSLIGSGPARPLELGSSNGRVEKIALPASVPLATSVAPNDDEMDELDEPDEAAVSSTEAVVEATFVEDPPASEPAVVEPTVVEPAVAEAAVAEPAPAEPLPAEAAASEAAPKAPPRKARWTYEPPEADEAPAPAPVVAPAAEVLVPPTEPPGPPTEPAPRVTPAPAAPKARKAAATANAAAAAEEETFPEPEERAPATGDDEAARATSSFDAALESLRSRMDRSKLSPEFVRGLLVPDSVLDVGETAMRWAGMPNKHERALTSEVFFALAEWGFLAPRADGRYRVLRAPDETKT